MRKKTPGSQHRGPGTAAKGIPYQTLIQLWVAEKAAGQDQQV
jgi:hypothetical protein